MLFLLPGGSFASAQHRRRPQKPVTRSASLTFIKKDGTCVDGPISRIDPKTVTVQQNQSQPVLIPRKNLLQVSQGDALVFSARSSWADVQAVRLRPRESFMLRLRNGKVIKGSPLQITADGMVFKHMLWMKKRYAKDQIVTVDYLRLKPDSNVFDYFGQEAPALLFFYPEFYDRLSGLEGRIPVRLYDALLKEDDAPLKCSRR
ncbi:MAG TPA: hypothetical protein VGG56_14660 [Terracidiphilus sp.]